MAIQVRASELDSLELRCRLVVRGKEGFGKSKAAKSLLKLAAACREASVALAEDPYCSGGHGEEAADVVKTTT